MSMILRNVNVFRDGGWKPSEVVIEDGLISSVADPGRGGAGEVFDLENRYASPGWVDLHTHLLPLRYGGIGTHTEKIGLRTGVTALVDVGTVGASNFSRLEEKVIRRSRIPVKCFLNIKRTGIRFWKVGTNEPGLDDIPAMERAALAHPEIIAGVKVTASKEHMLDFDPMYYVRKAIEAGERLCLPVMVHIGLTPPSLSEILEVMRPGDILTHCFRDGGHTILDEEGRIREDVAAAAARGVRFDVGHGVKSFDFGVAGKALEQGFREFSISSDLYMLSTPYRAINFANVLTKFLALGMGLDEIMHRASVLPGRAVGIDRGIEPGKPASITVFEILDRELVLKDCWNNERRADKMIRPSCVIHEGRFLSCG